MSFLPSVLVITIVMLLASASAQLVRDAALSQAQWEQQQQAMSRAELLLIQAASGLLMTTNQQPSGESDSSQEVLVEQLAISPSAELSDLPLSIFRISAIGRVSQLSVRLQADYALDWCDEDDEEKQEKEKEKKEDKENKEEKKANENKAVSCKPRIRRIAWRRLEN
jgi:hypothetical protein